MDWDDRMGWDVVGFAGFGALDCGWLEDVRGLLGAAVIVGLERVKPVSVVSQRAFLLLYNLSLDVLPSHGCSVGVHRLTSVVCRRVEVVDGDHEKETEVTGRVGRE